MSKYSAISWCEQVTFWWDYDDNVYFVLDQHAELDLYSASSLTQQSRGRHACHSTWTHFSYSKPISLCSYSLVLCATNTKFDSTRTLTQDLLHSFYRPFDIKNSKYNIHVHLIECSQVALPVKTVVEKPMLYDTQINPSMHNYSNKWYVIVEFK